jgi:prevent-host-death family protein
MQYFSTRQLCDNPSEVMTAAKTDPVLIVEADRPALVLMSMTEYDRLRGRGQKTEVVLAPTNEPDKDTFDGMPPFSLANYDLDRVPDESDEEYAARRALFE